MNPLEPATSRTLATVVTIVLGLLVVVMAGGLGYVIVGQGNVVETINRERVRNVRDGCESQNARHDDTIRRLERSGSGGESLALAAELIEALAPYRDCDVVVRRQTGESAP